MSNHGNQVWQCGVRGSRTVVLFASLCQGDLAPNCLHSEGWYSQWAGLLLVGLLLQSMGLLAVTVSGFTVTVSGLAVTVSGLAVTITELAVTVSGFTVTDSGIAVTDSRIACCYS